MWACHGRVLPCLDQGVSGGLCPGEGGKRGSLEGEVSGRAEDEQTGGGAEGVSGEGETQQPGHLSAGCKNTAIYSRGLIPEEGQVEILKKKFLFLVIIWHL